MVQSPVDPTRPLTPLTPFDTDPDIPRLDAHQTSHNSPRSPQGSGRPLPTLPQPSPPPTIEHIGIQVHGRLLLRPVL